MSTLPVTEMAPGSPGNPLDEAASARATVLVCIPSISAEGLYSIARDLRGSFPATNFLIASCNTPSDSLEGNGNMTMIEYPGPAAHSEWVLNASDYLHAANLALEHRAAATLLLGAEANSLSAEALHALCAASLEGGGDLVLPRYELGAQEGLVSASMLHPLSKALFGVEARMPLPLDVTFSARMAARLSVAAKRPSSVPGSDPLLWPASEAAAAAFVVHEVAVGHRHLPQPAVEDLNTLLAQVAGSMFADIEAKASFWQRSRALPLSTRPASAANPSLDANPDVEEVHQMAMDFRNAYSNLQEIWSLVLPPQSLLALKKLSLASPDAFLMPSSLWARTVYDFVLAFRLRTINRGHLLGALTPLYLAWAASHLRIANDSPDRANRHIEETAAAFIAEKPYILSRWRWPDRFNP